MIVEEEAAPAAAAPANPKFKKSFTIKNKKGILPPTV